jgi:hypothetical protein
MMLKIVCDPQYSQHGGDLWLRDACMAEHAKLVDTLVAGLTQRGVIFWSGIKCVRERESRARADGDHRELEYESRP